MGVEHLMFGTAESIGFDCPFSSESCHSNYRFDHSWSMLDALHLLESRYHKFRSCFLTPPASAVLEKGPVIRQLVAFFVDVNSTGFREAKLPPCLQ